MKSLAFKQIKQTAFELIFEPRDAWVGCYWRTWVEAGDHMISLFICVIPFVPLKVSWAYRKLATR